MVVQTAECTLWDQVRFDNKALQQLPLDVSKELGVRQVRGACFSLVDPTPVASPKLVVASQPALDLLGVTEEMVRKQ